MPNIDLTKCWINGAPPQAAPLQTDIAEHGSLIAFQLHAVRFLEDWLPLAPIIAQNKKAITYADKKTVAADVETTLRSIGISLIVGLDSGIRNAAMRNAVSFDPFTFVVNIAESPITNRGPRGTGITASLCAELVMLCFAGASIGNGGCSVKAFQTGGEEGTLQTAEVTLSTAFIITPPASMLTD